MSEPTTWEYRRTEHFEDLAALGHEGWELVAVVPAPGAPQQATFYLKRPAPDWRERVTQDQKRRYYALLGIGAPPEGTGP
jgi:hypothetical protein